MKKLNLPNQLTVLRLFMVPVTVIVLMISDAMWAMIAGLVLFCVASLTDMLDGKIARRNHLITDFGKFLDPLADKFMVIGAMMMILYRSMQVENPNRIFNIVFFIGVLTVIFRELAVTSVRLVVSSSSGVVIAANMLGKIKTCTQIGCVIACMLEYIVYRFIPALNFLYNYLPLSIATTAAMAFFTVWSGMNYILQYWSYLDPEK